MDSHSSVRRYQMCAFLLTLAAVYYLGLVAILYRSDAELALRSKAATTGLTAMTAISVIQAMIDDLLWWTSALKTARASGS